MKYKCKDVAFLLIARFDTIDRLENALMVTEYLANHFDTNIYLYEYASFDNGLFYKLKPTCVEYVFCHDENPVLHRTKHLNSMVENTLEPFVSIWDIDVIAPVCQVVESIVLLRKGVDIVYPYDSFFFDTSKELRKCFYKNRNIDFLLNNTSFMTELYPPKPVGGAFFANRQSYINSGLEREQFYGWGIEDGERFSRWKIQGKNVKRVQGPLFHLSHDRGINSRISSIESDLIKQRIYFKSLRDESWKSI